LIQNPNKFLTVGEYHLKFLVSFVSQIQVSLLSSREFIQILLLKKNISDCKSRCDCHV